MKSAIIKVAGWSSEGMVSLTRAHYWSLLLERKAVSPGCSHVILGAGKHMLLSPCTASISCSMTSCAPKVNLALCQGGCEAEQWRSDHAQPCGPLVKHLDLLKNNGKPLVEDGLHRNLQLKVVPIAYEYGRQSWESIQFLFFFKLYNLIKNLFIYLKFIYEVFFPYIFISWRIITLQYYSGFIHSLYAQLNFHLIYITILYCFLQNYPSKK